MKGRRETRGAALAAYGWARLLTLPARMRAFYMTIEQALVKAQEYMEKNARVVAEGMTKDGLTPQYRAKAHAAAAGRIMSHLLTNGVDELEPSAVNMTVLFHGLHNHSAWRQKFEKKGIFPQSAEAKAKDPAKVQDKLAKYMATLAEETSAEVE